MKVAKSINLEDVLVNNRNDGWMLRLKAIIKRNIIMLKIKKVTAIQCKYFLFYSTVIF